MSDADLIALALAARPWSSGKSEPRPGPRFEDRLRHAQKMDALGQITGGIAHDFNNLLLAINFNLESLAGEVPRTATTEPLFEGARAAVEQAHSLIGHLLTFARRQPLRPTSVDINDSVRQTQLMLRRAVPGSIEIETRLSDKPGVVLADRNQFETALLNLALNARDAMPHGGTLTIGTMDITLDDAYAAQHPGEPAGRYVLIAVSDTGSGMAASIVERAFEPFFTTKSGAEHSGLGLSQVYGYARQSGGHARIDSEPGRGTTVQMFLPRFGDTVSAAHRHAVPSCGNGEAILVVEDAPFVRNAVAKMVADLGCRPVMAAGAEEALALLESGGPIDLLLADLALPGGRSGEEVAATAVRLRPGLPVLYMSGHAERAPGGAPFIAKPFNKAQLAEQLGMALRCEVMAG